MTRTLKLNDAAREIGCSPDTLRKWIKGQRASGHKPAFEPILEQGIHWFRRGKNPSSNSPYLVNIEPAKEELARYGFYTARPVTLEFDPAEGPQ